MKKTELIIIAILTILYVFFSLFVSSVIAVVENKISFTIPSKEGFALIGAFVAFYNVFWNLYKYIRENIITKSISVSGVPRFNNGDIELECSFVNNSEYPITIDFCFLKGIAFDFSTIELREKENLSLKIIGKRIEGIKLSKNFLGKSNINFQYRFRNALSKYVNKKLKVDIRCIE